jgi:hypothetical protein
MKSEKSPDCLEVFSCRLSTRDPLRRCAPKLWPRNPRASIPQLIPALYFADGTSHSLFHHRVPAAHRQCKFGHRHAEAAAFARNFRDLRENNVQELCGRFLDNAQRCFDCRACSKQPSRRMSANAAFGSISARRFSDELVAKADMVSAVDRMLEAVCSSAYLASPATLSMRAATSPG